MKDKDLNRWCQCYERQRTNTWFLCLLKEVLFVYYEETKRELKRILMYECRCNERL
jgi:hypothetical protein